MALASCNFTLAVMGGHVPPINLALFRFFRFSEEEVEEAPTSGRDSSALARLKHPDIGVRPKIIQSLMEKQSGKP